MLAWSSEFVIGIPRIDRQHEAFVDLLNNFESARLKGASNKQLLAILNEISLFTKFHFCCEENLMEAVRYPGLEEHRERHLQGIDALSNLILSLTLGRISPEEVEGILRDWFFQHTLTEDRKIADFMKPSS